MEKEKSQTGYSWHNLLNVLDERRYSLSHHN